MSEINAKRAQIEAMRRKRLEREEQARKEEEDRRRAEETELQMQAEVERLEEEERRQAAVERARMAEAARKAAEEAEEARMLQGEYCKENGRILLTKELDETMATGTAKDAVLVRKGKRKETETEKMAEAEAEGDEELDPGAWTIVGGAGRCPRCVKAHAECKINLQAVEKWREDVESGKTFRKGPTNSMCTRCKIKKERCELPATEDMRAALVKEKPKAGGSLRVKEGSVTPSAASSSKRKRAETVVELPARKKKKTEPSGKEGEEEFRARLLAVLSGMSLSFGELVTVGKELVTAARETRKLAHHAAVTAANSYRVLERIADTLARKEEESESESDKVQEVPIHDARAEAEKSGEEDSEEEAEVEVKQVAEGKEAVTKGKEAEVKTVVKGKETEDAEMDGSGSEEDEESEESGENKKEQAEGK